MFDHGMLLEPTPTVLGNTQCMDCITLPNDEKQKTLNFKTCLVSRGPKKPILDSIHFNLIQ